MRTVTTRAELEAALAAHERPRALVPTMGALHAGHAALISTARRHAATVVVSLFVNPLQFGSATDLARYPRTLDADARLAEASGADVLFAPAVEEMYPPTEVIPTINPGPLAVRLEGASRPGHFAGVATVVSRLFDLVHPDLALFGEKDAQQVRVVEWLAAQRSDQIRIMRVATVRDRDGLALSSRNQRLSQHGRKSAARTIPVALSLVAEAYASGVRSVGTLRALAERVIASEPSVELDYLDFANGDSLAPLPDSTELHDTGADPILVSLAAVVDSVRLIDAITIP
ncbi:MAG: pantoate--beta-alanine ligase [Chloroflexi bacterium]|nr:pantoate--beta-alanine ligase [Chloroflexota bacterium]